MKYKSFLILVSVVIVFPLLVLAQEASFDAIAQQERRDFMVPAITNVAIAPSSTSVRIEWETDSPALSFIEYGTSPAYGARIPLAGEKLSLSNNHRAEITGLSEFRTYHFRIRAKAQGSENEAFSRPLTFMTLPSGSSSYMTLSPTPADFSAPSIQLFVFGKGTALAISANEPSIFRLEYGAYVRDAPFIFEEKEQNSERADKAQLFVRGTTPGSLYVYRLTAQDRYGNRAVMLGNFQTPVSVQNNAADIRKKSKESLQNKEAVKNKEIRKNKESEKNKEKPSYKIPSEWLLLIHPIQLKVLFPNEVWRDAATGRVYRIVGKQKKPFLIGATQKAVKQKMKKSVKTPTKKPVKNKTKENKQEVFIPFYR